MKEETALEKWDRGKTLLLESLYKPDSKLRGCAYNQGCFDEMIRLRDSVIEYVTVSYTHLTLPTIYSV